MLNLKIKPDIIFVYQTSPITVGIPAIVAKKKFKGVPIYFWVQDLWPDSLKDTGAVKSKIILNVVLTLTKYIYGHSKVLLVQSKAFIGFISKQGVSLDKIIYFPNPTERFYKISTVTEEYSKLFPDGFNLIFAGNIGEAQSFDTLIDAALTLRKLQYQIYWNIFGDGRAKNHYVKKVIDLKLEDFFIFHGSLNSEEMPYCFACAEALIVSLKKSKIFSLTIPAKVQSYLACGKPIIGSIDGEGAKIVIDSGAGYVSPSENSEMLVSNIIQLYSLSSLERATMGEKGRVYFEKEFHTDLLVEKLERIFGSAGE